MTALPVHRRVWRMIRLRPRLVIATLVGLAVWGLLPAEHRPSTRGLIGWNAGAMLYLVTSWVQMLRADIASLRRRAAKQDEAEWIVLALAIAATLVSLAAIGIELHVSGPGDQKPPLSHLGLAGLTIAISWAFIHTVITLHYARLFYGTGSKPVGGLEFPKTVEPDYADFLYFSFTIGAAAQTSDVAVSSRAMRRVVLVQTILAFLFNTTILALAINIGASLI
ncbi:hypothetical protein GCM10011390_49390 [Aureimonas endophytica]|uniref:DUF1345 domain-containing protein n=1 Tax=Aureimonas endophytica TaxID=2027858 RepID=A0A917EEI2_9HYPH|nr:DUF1345 domain-containing protein [Aureimonas endophytica]GGE24105.1 hypothetical protein GCM10011390_49390 [Aureimonas endophytica]